MKAITVEPGRAERARLEEVPEPDASEGPVLVEAVAVGVCARCKIDQSSIEA